MADWYELKVMKMGKDGKEHGTKIGAGFPWKKGGNGFNLIFDALPTPTMNDQGQIEVKVLMAEPYDKDKPRVAGSTETKVDLDDEIPF